MEKDRVSLLLEQYIIDQTDSLDQQYEILATWGLRYLNNNGYWNAGIYSSSALGVVPYNAKEWGAATGTNFTISTTSKIEIDPMITHTMPPEQINDAFDLMHKGESIRSVINFS